MSTLGRTELIIYCTYIALNEGVVSKETVVLRRWEVVYKNLVLSTELIM